MDPHCECSCWKDTSAKVCLQVMCTVDSELVRCAHPCQDSWLHSGSIPGGNLPVTLRNSSQMCTSVGMMGAIDLDLKPLDLIFLSAEKNHAERVIISLGKDQD